MGQISNREALVFSERGQLSQAIPQVHVERIPHQRTPIARFESQCNERRTKFCVFRGRCDRQRTLVIRIAAITLASDSAITLARFLPSKVLGVSSNLYTSRETKLCKFDRNWETFKSLKISGLQSCPVNPDISGCKPLSPKSCIWRRPLQKTNGKSQIQFLEMTLAENHSKPKQVCGNPFAGRP